MTGGTGAGHQSWALGKDLAARQFCLPEGNVASVGQSLACTAVELDVVPKLLLHRNMTRLKHSRTILNCLKCFSYLQEEGLPITVASATCDFDTIAS